MRQLIGRYLRVVNSGVKINSMGYSWVEQKRRISDVMRCGFSTVGKGQVERVKGGVLENTGEFQLQKLFSEAQSAVDDFLSIDTVKSTPGGLSSMIKLLVRTLQRDPQHFSRQFYTKNRQKLDKFIYDLRSYNSQSWMTTQDLLLSFYLCKLAMDYGYQYVVAGFELRGGVRLLSLIVVSAGGKNSEQKGLTVNQTIFGMWIMSHMRFSNHQYKWKCLQYLQLLAADYSKRLMSQKRRLNSTDQLQVPIPPPFTLSQLSSVLQTYYMQELHMSMEYQILEFVVEKLYVYRGYFLAAQRYDEGPEVYVEVFTQLLGVEMGFLNGRKFYELQEVVRIMVNVMYRKIGWGCFGDEQVLGEFIGCRSVEEFVANTKWAGVCSEAKLNAEIKQSKQVTQQQTYRNFILLNQIRQNNQWFSIISKQDCSKLHFLLFSQLSQTFTSLQPSGTSLQLRSIQLRTWLHKKQYQMESLQMEVRKISDPKEKTQKIRNYVEGLVGEFDRQLTKLGQVLKAEMEGSFGVGVDKKMKKRREKYLLAEEKEGLRLKMAFVRNLQQSFFKPLTDFLYSNGKPTIMNTLLIGRQKLHMIQKLQQLISDVLDNQSNIEMPECENRYFWLFKFMRLDSVNCTDNKMLLKEFQLLIEEQIGGNLEGKQNKVYSVVTVYNMYAYMCKLEERMVVNEELKQRSQHSELSEESSIIEPISKKKEYSFFLAYKTYLASLIYPKQSPEDKQTKSTKIPEKYLIQSHYIRQVPQSHYFSHYQGRSSSKTPQSTTFSIELFFNIVFKANRYYNHKILSEELLLYLFGTEEALAQNLMKYILNTNQRSGENLYELMYVMFLAKNTEIGTKDIHHTLPIKAIKTKLIQACSEKAKGSLFNLILRDIMSPRKTSFLKKSPLKYRGKPYSIFEALSKQSCERKMQIMHEFLESFSFNKNMVFGIVEMIFLNLEAWGKDKSQIANKVVFPWLANKIKSKDVVEANVHFFVLLAFRLVRFEMTKIDKSSEKLYQQFFLDNLCPLFQQLSSDDKSYSYNKFKGYLTEIQHLNKLSKLPKQTLHEILVSCMEYHRKNTGNGSNTRNETYLKLMEVFERLIKATGQTRNSQVNAEYTPSQRKMFSQHDRQNSREGKSQVRQVRKGGMFGKQRVQ